MITDGPTPQRISPSTPINQEVLYFEFYFFPPPFRERESLLFCWHTEQFMMQAQVPTGAHLVVLSSVSQNEGSGMPRQWQLAALATHQAKSCTVSQRPSGYVPKHSLRRPPGVCTCLRHTASQQKVNNGRLVSLCSLLFTPEDSISCQLLQQRDHDFTK